MLDVTFNEGDCRIRRGDGVHNFALLRRIALTLIKQEKSVKSSVRLKRMRAGWSTDHLQKLLGIATAVTPAASCDGPGWAPTRVGYVGHAGDHSLSGASAWTPHIRLYKPRF